VRKVEWVVHLFDHSSGEYSALLTRSLEVNFFRVESTALLWAHGGAAAETSAVQFPLFIPDHLFEYRLDSIFSEKCELPNLSLSLFSHIFALFQNSFS
jgi:hypothetical protein